MRPTREGIARPSPVTFVVHQARSRAVGGRFVAGRIGAGRRNEEHFMSKVSLVGQEPVVSHVPAPALLASRRRIEAALDALRRGRPVLVQDDADRENEADLIVAGDRLNAANMTPLIRDCSGIVCLCLTPAHAHALGLKPMVEDNRTRFGTAFTASIEAAQGISTGVSARDRVTTVRAAMSAARGRGDHADIQFVDARAAIVSPGHVFPLIARAGGVLERRGHTEATVDLARWAGLTPAGVLCELMNPDGTMAVGEEVNAYAYDHRLVIVHIEEVVGYARGMADGPERVAD